MLEKFFLKGRWIAGIRGGPLGHYVDTFSDDLIAQGYTRISVRQGVSAAGRFSRWLDKHRLGARDVSEETIARFRRRRCRRRWRTGESLLHRLLQRLRQEGAAPERVVQINLSHLERIEQDFGDYLRRERGFSPATIQNYSGAVRRLLSQRFGTGPIDLSVLSVIDIRTFVSGYAQGRPPKVVQLTLTGLRSFLRFLYLRGDLTSQLADHVPRPPSWGQDHPPQGLTVHETDLVLNRCDRQSATGRRDFAILLLLARLGLRAGEIRSLRLDDIRWEAGEIVVCGKGQHRKRFPLPKDVGEAIASYLKRGRPRCSSRHVFLRTKAPCREFTDSSAIYFIVATALARAGLSPLHRGPHLFRHSLATNMMHNGATLSEIGHILHHRSPDTTAIYAKADITGLRAVALPWPGEGS